jgi:hypothetical protein
VWVRMRVLARAVNVAPGPLIVGIALLVVMRRGGVGLGGVGVAEGEASYKRADYDTALAAIPIFEAYNDHTVASQAPPPTMDAVFDTDAAREHELLVAARADVVVAIVTCRAVVAGV